MAAGINSLLSLVVAVANFACERRRAVFPVAARRWTTSRMKWQLESRALSQKMISLDPSEADAPPPTHSHNRLLKGSSFAR